MAIAMVAMLAFGGTYAYFTATTTATPNKTLTTATVQLKAPTITTIEAETKVVPGLDLLESPIKIENNSDTGVYVFVTLDVYAEKVLTEGEEATKLEFKNVGGTKINNPFVPVYSTTKVDGADIANFTQLTGVKDAEDKTISTVYYAKLDANVKSVEFVNNIKLSTEVHSNSTETQIGDVMAATIVITVTAEAIQSETLTTASAAYVALHSDCEVA